MVLLSILGWPEPEARVCKDGVCRFWENVIVCMKSVLQPP